jgi:hypothetical protein
MQTTARIADRILQLVQYIRMGLRMRHYATSWKVAGSRNNEVIGFFLFLILPDSNRNEYQKQKNCFWGAERGRIVRPTTSSPSVSPLSTQCGILNISQSYRPPRPVTEIALLFISRWYSYLTGNTPMGHHGLLRNSFTFLYLEDVRTSQETQLWASTTC